MEMVVLRYLVCGDGCIEVSGVVVLKYLVWLY